MEVHHHSNVHHSKKWKDYLYEFIMLFLAVFCGFLVENWREHLVEHERERQYMQSFIYDLENDTMNLNAGFPLKDERIKAIDSIFIFFQLNPDVKKISGNVYRYMQRSYWDRHYRRNSTTIDQLKNAGGMRLIRDKIVSDSIAAYDLQWQRSDFWKEMYINNQAAGKNYISKILIASDLLSIYRKNSTGEIIKGLVPDTMMIQINNSYLNEYLNFLNYQKNTTMQDSKNYKRLEESAVRLLEKIKKEYHL